MKHSEMKAEQDAIFTVDVVVLVDAVFLISIWMRWKLQRTSRKKLHCSSQLSALWKVGKTTIESLPRLFKWKFCEFSSNFFNLKQLSLEQSETGASVRDVLTLSIW